MIFYETSWSDEERQRCVNALYDRGLSEVVPRANASEQDTAKTNWALSELEESQEIRRYNPNARSRRVRRDYRKKVGKWVTEDDLTEISEQMNSGTVMERIRILRSLAETADPNRLGLYGGRDWWWVMGADYMLKQIDHGMRLNPRQAHSVLKMLLRDAPTLDELQARMEAQHAAVRLAEKTPQVLQSASRRL